jgi:hypothetical protein
MFAYAIGRAAGRAAVEELVFGTPLNVDRAAQRMIKIYARLNVVKGRLNV